MAGFQAPQGYPVNGDKAAKVAWIKHNQPRSRAAAVGCTLEEQYDADIKAGAALFDLLPSVRRERGEIP